MAGIFNEAVLTTKGIALLAKAQAGECSIVLTKGASGSGSYSSSGDLQSMTALKNQQQEFSINTVYTQNETNVYVKFIITNNPDSGALTTGYYVTEVGIFATDPDEGEILYAIATAVDEQWDYMPSYNDLVPATITIEFLIEVDNASAVTITSPNKTYVYDDTDGTKYVIGVEDGVMYFEEVDE